MDVNKDGAPESCGRRNEKGGGTDADGRDGGEIVNFPEAVSSRRNLTLMSQMQAQVNCLASRSNASSL